VDKIKQEIFNMDFDLDIKNYSIRDLEIFFKLDTKTKYDEETIEEHSEIVYETILVQTSLDRPFKRKIKQFLQQAKQILLYDKSKHGSDNLLHDGLPKNQLSNESKYPLIKKHETPYQYSVNSDYFTGKLNPIEKHLNTKMLAIDTLFRPNYFQTKSTDFLYKFPEPMNNVVSMELVALELPRMFFEFSSENNDNVFSITVHNYVGLDGSMNDAKTHKIVIPDGNYTSVTFCYFLNNYFINVRDGLQYLYVEIDNDTSNFIFRTVTIFDKERNQENRITIPYDISLGYYQGYNLFTQSAVGSNAGSTDKSNPNYDISAAFVQYTNEKNPYYSPQFSYTLDFMTTNTYLYENLGWMMGFRKSSYTITKDNSYNNIGYNANTGGNLFLGYIESEGTFGSNYSKYLYLEVDDFNNNSQTNTLYAFSSTQSFISNNILARVGLNNVPYTILEINNADLVYKKREYYGQVKLEKLKFRLLNNLGKVVNMNNNDYSFVLEFKQLYST
jgi:hypothetical protein